MYKTVMIDGREYKIVTEGCDNRVDAYAKAPECWKRTEGCTTYRDKNERKWYLVIPT